MRPIILFAALMLWTPSALAGVAAPKVSIETTAALPTPLPYPYDEQADAEAAVTAALARAKASGKRTILDFGGNWCPDCRILAGVMALPEVKPFIDAHFEVVTIDVGRMNRNMQIASRFGISRMLGVPTVLVVDSDGTALNPDDTGDMPNARELSPQAILDWLAGWAKAPQG